MINFFADTDSMPAAPLRKLLLRGAFAYAKCLQELHCRVLNSRATSSSDSELDLNPHAEPEDSDNNSDSSISSLSSLSLLSSISSLSSLSSIDLEIDALEADIPQALPLDDTGSSHWHSDSDYEEDLQYLSRLQAVREQIHYLETTQVLFPNTVHKLSQLYLVLVAYKEDDPTHFRHNLHASPETFDVLLAKIEGHPIFQNASPNKQLAVDRQLAIALFWFGHFGNSASVESVAQWAGCSADMVVNATR
jgi:hypothetical protein